MTDTIDRERLARRRAIGQQLMAYVNEHEAEWMEISTALEEACQAYQSFYLKAGGTVNGSVNACVGHVTEFFFPTDAGDT